jgi:hypothetical protein
MLPQLARRSSRLAAAVLNGTDTVTVNQQTNNQF